MRKILFLFLLFAASAEADVFCEEKKGSWQALYFYEGQIYACEQVGNSLPVFSFFLPEVSTLTEGRASGKIKKHSVEGNQFSIVIEYTLENGRAFREEQFYAR